MPIGRRVSTFYMWPPTEENLTAFDQASESGQELHTLSAQLSHGIKQTVTSEHALLLPSGTIHAVCTFTDGFIVTKGYLDRASVMPLSALIGNSPNYLARLSPDGREALLHRYIVSATFAPAAAAQAWERAAPGMYILVRELSRRGVQKTWRAIQEYKESESAEVMKKIEDLLRELRPDEIPRSAVARDDGRRRAR